MKPKDYSDEFNFGIVTNGFVIAMFDNPTDIDDCGYMLSNKYPGLTITKYDKDL